MLLAFFRARDDVAERFETLGAFARLSAAGDGAASSNQAMTAQMGALEARTSAALSFVSLELLALPDGKIESYLSDEAGLGPYRKQVADILRRRGHVLSADAERAIAALGIALPAHQQRRYVPRRPAWLRSHEPLFLSRRRQRSTSCWSGSTYDLAKRAGVDLTSPEPFQRTVAYFGKLVEELEASFPAVPTAEDTTWLE